MMPKYKIDITVVGLGYVGLPVAVKLSQSFKVTGYDKDLKRIKELKKGFDRTNEFKFKEIRKKTIKYSSNESSLKNSNFYIVTVPTPVNKNKSPNLNFLKQACITISKFLKKKDIVVFESTTYPGCTEEFCIPLLEKNSGLKINKDFYCGYSPERINPGDKKHKLDNIEKIISATNLSGLNVLNYVYKKLTKKKLIKTENIKIAESAKIIENTQRDINIALMNELSILFDKLDIDFTKVLEAANSKWNFLNFKPGLVGGHCIGVDPYYLSDKAKKVKFNTKIILAGRKINDGINKHIVAKIKKKFTRKKREKKLLIIGLTFKENVPDIRNSQILNIISDLSKLKFQVYLFDPLVNLNLKNCKNIKTFNSLNKMNKFFDCVILTVPHKQIIKKGFDYFYDLKKDDGFFFDLKNTFKKKVDFKL